MELFRFSIGQRYAISYKIFNIEYVCLPLHPLDYKLIFPKSTISAPKRDLSIF